MWCPHFKIWTKPAKSLRKSVCYLYWAKFVHPSKPIAQHYACQIGIGALMLTLQPELRINNSDDNVCYSLCSNKIWKLACLLPDYGLLNIMLLAYLFFLFYSLSLLIPFFLRSSWKVCIHLLKRRREKKHMYGKSDFDHYKWAFKVELKPICTSCKGMSDKSVTVATNIVWKVRKLSVWCPFSQFTR